MKEGQSYVGVTAQVNDSKGNSFASFRKDGSIMFANEGGAYARMVTNTKKIGNEELAAITDNGVLVLPSYNNTPTEGKFTEYGYSSKNGNMVDALSGNELNTVAIAHTHPNGTEPTGFNGDGSFMAGNFPNKPNYILKTQENRLGISYIIANSTSPFSWKSGATGSLSNVPGMTINNIVSGKVSLRQFTKQNRIRMINSITK